MSGGGRRGKLGEASAPIIIVKKKSHKGGHHGGSWKVAYADFVTTMMALFIVLWASGQSSDIRSSIAQHFRNPTVPIIKTGGQGAGVLPASTGVVAEAQAQSPIPSDGRGSPPEDTEAELEATRLREAAMTLREEFDQDPELAPFKTQLRVELTDAGLRIQLVEKDENLFFDIGSTRINPALAHTLRIVGSVVGTLPNEVAIEGHTDTRRYTRTTREYTNWELSTDRANSARRFLEQSGLKLGQVVRVVGHAHNDLLVREDPLDAQNRRVSIIVLRRLPVVTSVNSAREGLIHMRSAIPSAERADR